MFHVFCFLISLQVASAEQFSQEEIKNLLREYRQQKLPLATVYPKKLSRKSEKIFTSRDVQNENFVSMKRQLRARISDVRINIYSEPARNDNPNDLLEDPQVVDSVTEMDAKGLRQGEANVKPWSDDYWPYYKGSLGARYNDPKFPSASDWQTNFDYIAANRMTTIFESSPELIDSLSPAEKYDLLFDKSKTTLTKSLWLEGAYYFKMFGKVEAWMGICHGWAAASYMTLRPEHFVDVVAFDGKTSIRFYPDDIKALQSLLWANAQPSAISIGGRCQEKDPKRDELGRTINRDCLDNNPASWHKTIVNRMGLHRRSFILDATYDYEVWNQPVVSYSYSYFNPETMESKDTLPEAKVKIADFANDQFKKFRAKNALSIIGIAMQVTYAVERRPTHSEFDGPKNDRTRTVMYAYDLELNGNDEVVGGEWYRLPRPDFLWTPVKDSKALSTNDYYLLNEPNWDGKTALPALWQKHATEAGRAGQPLAKVIDSLIELSKKR